MQRIFPSPSYPCLQRHSLSWPQSAFRWQSTLRVHTLVPEITHIVQSTFKAMSCITSWWNVKKRLALANYKMRGQLLHPFATVCRHIEPNVRKTIYGMLSLICSRLTRPDQLGRFSIGLARNDLLFVLTQISRPAGQSTSTPDASATFLITERNPE